jgi:hypothetical protein
MDCRPWWLSGLIQKRTREQGDYCHCDGPRRRQRKWKSLPGFAVWWCDGNRRMDWRESLEDEDRQGNGIHFRTSGGERSIRITPVKAPSCTLSLSLNETLLSVSDLCRVALHFFPRLVATTMTDGPDTLFLIGWRGDERRAL